MSIGHYLRAALGLIRLVSPRHACASVAVIAGLAATEGVGVLMLVPMLQLVGVGAGAPGGDRIVEVFDAAFSTLGVRPTLGVVLSLYVAVAAAQGALSRWQSLLTVHIEQDIVTALRRRLYRAASQVRWEVFARKRSADFTHALTEETDRVASAAYYALNVLVSGGVVLVYVGVAFYMSPAVTSLVTMTGVLLVVLMRGRFDAARRHGTAVSHATSRLYATLAEHLGGMKTARSYGATDRHEAIFAEVAGDLRRVRVRSAREYGRFRQLMTLGSAAALAGIVYVSVDRLALPTASLLVLLFVFARLMPRLTGLYEKAQALVGELPAFVSVSELAATCEAGAPPALVSAGATLSGDVRFDRVTFAYEGSDASHAAVSEVELVIAAGATTAIVGSSGAGKSTVADLLLGLVEPATGRILVGGQPLTGDAVHAWRQQIGYVPQDTFLFHDTVRANLLWARPDAHEDDLREALRLAGADAFVASLPQGLATIVGDRGVLLSGGERQRLSLARALVRRPRLLLLDEATSSLDSENEARIQRAIDDLHSHMTIVVITHRLSAIRHADAVYVMDRGRVVEAGTWDTLLAQRGRFAELCRAQGLGAVSAPRPVTMAAR